MKKNSEYEKMPKTLKQLGLSEKAFNDVTKLKWTVTEKIHGANFSFVYEGRKLLFAKRKDYLAWNDDFFGFQEVVEKIEDNILALFEQLSQEIEADKYIIYGELFGGKYPHPDVPAHPSVEAIQTGVYYCPSVNFCAFDIAYETGGKKHYVDYTKAIRYFEASGVFYAHALFTGKLNEAMEFNTRINSKVPAQLGLPELSENLIEGVVIKPASHSELKDLEFRPVVKLKNPEFDEEKKFHEAEKWSFVPKAVSRSEELSFILDELSDYLNENRLNSAVSKTGKIDLANPARMEEIRSEIVNDTWTDFNGNNNGLLDELTEEQKEWVRKRMRVMVEELIRKSQIPS